MIACINGPSKQQKMSATSEGMLFVVDADVPYERFPQPGSASVNDVTTKRNEFTFSDIVVNPYDESIVANPIFGEIFERGCFCFLSRGWYMVVNMFHVEVYQH